MKNVFLLRFSGGSCGDFLTGQISEDPNFYSAEKTEGPNNVWNLVNPLRDYSFHLKENEFPVIPDKIRDDIDRDFSEKHLIVGTHSWHHNIMDINLPRMCVVRLVSTGHMTFLFYFLLWIKRHIMIRNDYEFFERYVVNNSYYGMDKKIQSIHNNGYFRAVERACFRLKVYPHIDSVDNFFPSYYAQSEAISDTYWKKEHIRLDVGELFNNVEFELPKWEKAFDMSGHLNAAIIQENHNKDLVLFETALGCAPASYKSRFEFLHDMKSYITKICPDLCE